MYSVVVAMAIATTLLVPPFIPRLVRWAENPLTVEAPDADRARTEPI
jgi:hypothetical protein